MVQSDHIGFAVIEQVGLFLSSPRATAQCQVAHLVLGIHIHGGQTEVLERADQAVAKRCANPVGAAAKLCEQVQQVVRQRPAKTKKAVHLGTGKVSHRHCLRVNRKRGRLHDRQIILPVPAGVTAWVFANHQTNRLRLVPFASIGGTELKVDQMNAVGVVIEEVHDHFPKMSWATG